MALRLPDDRRWERAGIAAFLGVVVVVNGLAVVGSGSPREGNLALIALMVTAAFTVLTVRRLPRLLLAGFLGGAAAGLLFGGVGGRVAMRIVMLMGGRSETSLEGTMFLATAMTVIGGVLGIGVAAVRRLFPRVRPWAVAAFVLAIPGGPLFLNEATRAELRHEGSVWLNVPMFFGLLAGYGGLATVWSGRLEDAIGRHSDARRARRVARREARGSVAPARGG